jgi:tRNA-splicing ligase RtcB
MRVPGLVIADDQLIESIRSDASLDQIANGATLPGIVRAAMAMPDIHQGYGLPVGGVVATDARHGVVSPGAIGFDINCGVRLLATSLRSDAIADRMETLVDALFAAIPTGVGSRSELALDPKSLDQVSSAAPPGPFAPDTATQRISSGSSPGAARRRRAGARLAARARAGQASARHLGLGNHFSRCRPSRWSTTSGRRARSASARAS